MATNSQYLPKINFDEGITKKFANIIERVLPNYESNPKYTSKIKIIKKFYRDLINPVNIKLVSDAAGKTLDIIKQDVINYVITSTNTNIKQGGEEGASTGVMPNIALNLAPSIAPNITTTYVEKPVSMNLSAPYTQSTQPNLATQSTQVIQSTQYLEKMKEELSTHFTSYFNECVDRFEAIRPNNQLINSTMAPSGDPLITKVLSIRPPMLKFLIPELLMAFSTNNSEKIKLVVHSIIEWYLSHNKVAGIDLSSYDVMLVKITSTNDDYKEFIYDINSYLVNK